MFMNKHFPYFYCLTNWLKSIFFLLFDKLVKSYLKPYQPWGLSGRVLFNYWLFWHLVIFDDIKLRRHPLTVSQGSGPGLLVRRRADQALVAPHRLFSQSFYHLLLSGVYCPEWGQRQMWPVSELLGWDLSSAPARTLRQIQDFVIDWYKMMSRYWVSLAPARTLRHRD